LSREKEAKKPKPEKEKKKKGEKDTEDDNESAFSKPFKREVIFWQDFVVAVAILFKGSFEERFEGSFHSLSIFLFEKLS
jgi:hypothetical protein